MDPTASPGCARILHHPKVLHYPRVLYHPEGHFPAHPQHLMGLLHPKSTAGPLQAQLSLLKLIGEDPRVAHPHLTTCMNLFTLKPTDSSSEHHYGVTPCSAQMNEEDFAQNASFLTSSQGKTEHHDIHHASIGARTSGEEQGTLPDPAQPLTGIYL